MNLKRIHVFVEGIVQGVGFRYATLGEARRRNLSGWVRNTADDRVEILAEGPADQVDGFLSWCGVGPAAARVTNVQVRESAGIEKAAADGFEIRR